MLVNAQVQEILERYAVLGPLPIAILTPEQARQLPAMKDAMIGVIGKHITTRTMTSIPQLVG